MNLVATSNKHFRLEDMLKYMWNDKNKKKIHVESH